MNQLNFGRKKILGTVKQVPMDTTYSKEEDDDDYEDEGSHSSSSETLTCSGPEVQETSLFMLCRVALVSPPHLTKLLNCFSLPRSLPFFTASSRLHYTIQV